MADTYYSINIHYVFGTKKRRPYITGELGERLPLFMGGILRKHGVKGLCIGGTSDHIHILASLPTVISISKVAQVVKGGSSKWIHDTFPDMRAFSWQDGYGAFSVSVSHVSETIAYIINQPAHHTKRSFEEEYIAFLKKHAVEYNERHLLG
jgi:putative transposase